MSESTREIVETFLEDDPKLQLLVEEMEQEPQLPTVFSYKAEKNENRQQRVKRLLFQHNLFLALAILSSLLWFFVFSMAPNGVRVILIVNFIVAMLFWTGFLNANYKLKQMDA